MARAPHQSASRIRAARASTGDGYSVSGHWCDRLESAVARCGAPVAVGLDPVVERLPLDLRPTRTTAAAACESIAHFCREVIDAISGVVPCVKINSAFFEAYYEHGVQAFYELIAHAHRRELLVIADVKRGDIGSTARLYAKGHIETPMLEDIDPLRAPDAVTLAGYLGRSAVAPFAEIAERTGRGVYVLVRPSEPGADVIHEFGERQRLFQHMASLVDEWGGAPEMLGECGLSCVGAVVAPKDEPSTAALRAAMPRTPWLVPGYGAQGSDAAACAPCFLPGGRGALVNASRSVIYAFERDPAAARSGGDWVAAIAGAAETFARDIRAVATP
ncbi:MAG: orotidine-5'-phosphate decarboxylase [Planctomycetota bacterium]|nr:MAG: orotidine-5'-phosphate decarboxylase [Planctomycetota bacterium]